MSELINIVEPTLKDDTGHCMSFVKSLIATTKNIHFQVWADSKCKISINTLNTSIEKYFFRSFRKFQCFFLYSKLLSTSGKVFIATASRLDLTIFNWVAKGKAPANKVYFYFHWLNISASKISGLKALARSQPEFVIITPNQSVANTFREAGFNHVRLVPYPTQSELPQTQHSRSFSHAMYAGAARKDKGFSRVVDLIGLAQKQQRDIPFFVQTSPDHHGKYDADILDDLGRLRGFDYPYLQVCDETMSTEQYNSKFEGAICIQAYSAKVFSDRVSGVTLDAFLAGCPIISGAGTWTANQVSRFNAGIIVESTSPDSLLAALLHVIGNYDFYCMNAINAGEIIKVEHDSSHLAAAILTDVQ